MNLLPDEALDLVEKINGIPTEDHEVIAVFPSLIYLHQLHARAASSIVIGAQNAYFEPKGAFTGEVSVHQLAAMGIHTLLVGHSERRDIFGESNALLKHKVDAAIRLGMTVFFCCGEQLSDREEGQHFQQVSQQLKESLFHLNDKEMQQVVIAYEPVWAIGTGVTASAEQAEEMHAFIRNLISEQYGESTANATSIIYGGSCKPSNAAELFAQKNIDGGLIGGAALAFEDFEAIIKAGQLV